MPLYRVWYDEPATPTAPPQFGAAKTSEFDFGETLYSAKYIQAKLSRWLSEFKPKRRLLRWERINYV